MSLPLLKDIELTQTKYEPGDRIIVRSSVLLDRSQKRRIIEGVVACTGEHVRVFIAETCVVRLAVDKADGECVIIAGHEHTRPLEGHRLQVGCAKVILEAGDRVTALVKHRPDKATQRNFEAGLRDWVGPDLETTVLWGI